MYHRTIHFPGKQRFEQKTGSGEPAVISYRQQEDTVIIESTYVPAAFRGKGIAASMVEDALLEARRLGWKIIPDCSYTENYILRNPEFSHLLQNP